MLIDIGLHLIHVPLTVYVVLTLLA
jgi:hypothetical protein